MNDNEPLSFSGQQFVFDQSLPDKQSYQVRIARQPSQQLCIIKGAEGRVTGENISDIEVRCSSWREPERVDRVSDYYTSTYMQPRVRINDSGRAMVLWKYANAQGIPFVQSSSYSPDAGWIDEKAISPADNAALSNHLRLALNGSGNALAVVQHDPLPGPNSTSSILASAYNSITEQWRSFESLGDTAGSAGLPAQPEVVLHDNGQGMAVWIEEQEGQVRLLSRSYDGSVWAQESALVTPTDMTGRAARPQLAMDAQGNIWAAWQQRTNTDLQLLARAYRNDDW